MQDNDSRTVAPPPRVDAQMIDVAGSPVAMRRRGTGAPLLFLHGGGFIGAWLAFHEALAREADVIAPEHIGMGGTPMQDWVEGIDDMVLHYDDLRACLGLEQFDLVGYSIGGWMAAEYAMTYPERVRTLSLLVPAGLRLPGRPGARDPFALGQDLVPLLFHDEAALAASMPTHLEIDDIVRIYEEQSLAARLIWSPRHSRKLPRRLRRVTCPALVIGAEDDRFQPHEATAAYTELLPRAEETRIPGTGHALIVEQPDAVASTILEFIGRDR
jgi:pimeloyl-ACP methyl ester carboxylesterase